METSRGRRENQDSKQRRLYGEVHPGEAVERQLQQVLLPVLWRNVQVQESCNDGPGQKVDRIKHP